MVKHDDKNYLNNLSMRVRQANREKGWDVIEPEEWTETNYKVPAVLALIHSEVTEALEAYRKDDHENFQEELVDILIRVLDLAGVEEDFDIDMKLKDKMEFNRQRQHRHGGKKL